MEKILLEVITVTTSVTHNESFVVILGEVDGRNRLPIVIGNAEAQSIVIAMEKMKLGRPLTHDLIKNMMDSFDIVVKEIVINRFMEGIFYSQIICEKDGVVQAIDSRTSDAIALAMRYDCPIYTYNPILEDAGVEMDILENDIEEPASEQESKPYSTRLYEVDERDELKESSLDELEHMLQESLGKEEYEKAAKIRDEIDNRKLK